ncbi:MAG: adenylate kinase [Cyanobacteria bacterium P01_A01_bin.40]
MKKVAVFGNAGGGKSTLSKNLAELTGLPLVVLDLVKYKPGGVEVSDDEYQAAHAKILQQDRWIIDGYGSWSTVWERLEVADTLVYIDLPVVRHYWWVTKRFLKGIFIPPESWPQDTPLLKGTINSYYTVWLCEKKLTPRYREYIHQVRETKRVFHLKSLKDIDRLYQVVSKNQ